MDLAAYSIDCSDDLGERLGYIVTLVLSFVAFSDTLFQQIPNVPYLTFLEQYVLFNYLFTTVTLIQTAVSSWTGTCEDDANNIWWAGVLFMAFIIEHIGFICAAFSKRSYELRKLIMPREQIEREIASKKDSLYLKYTYGELRNQIERYKKDGKKTKLFSFRAQTNSDSDLTKITFCCGIVEYLLNGVLRYHENAQNEGKTDLNRTIIID